ncbi:hypothetical protein VTK73DRAFT_8451 [Phialemonium thermophilum]|uniref:NB-ARC domain-containing protein n=1 Tax=Phialemonium thermophilum TaxID=223376 RepID=A0ABR3W973_9PEZI
MAGPSHVRRDGFVAKLDAFLADPDTHAKYIDALDKFLDARPELVPVTNILPADEVEERLEIAYKALGGKFSASPLSLATFMTLPLGTIRGKSTEEVTELFSASSSTVKPFLQKYALERICDFLSTPDEEHGGAQEEAQDAGRDVSDLEARIVQCKSRDGRKCVLLGTADPDVCHILPFSLTSSTLDIGQSVDIRQLLTEKPGSLDKAWNMVCLNAQLHRWWSKCYFGFRCLGILPPGSDHDTLSTVKLQFCWVKSLSKIAMEQAAGGGLAVSPNTFDVERGDPTIDQARALVTSWREGLEAGAFPSQKCSARSSGAIGAPEPVSCLPTLSGRTVYIRLPTEEAFQMKAMVDVQWACIQLATLSGAAEEPIFWLDDGDKMVGLAPLELAGTVTRPSFDPASSSVNSATPGLPQLPAPWFGCLTWHCGFVQLLRWQPDLIDFSPKWAQRTPMEALGVAANVIAVVDLSAKVATLCFRYSKQVASARADIQRLQGQVQLLETALQATRRLVEGPRGPLLSTSQELASSLRGCIRCLRQVEKRLSPDLPRGAMRRLGLRAWKWPFLSRDVDQIIASLQHHQRAIGVGLQIDQTHMLMDIQDGIKQLSLSTTEDRSVSDKPHRVVPFPPDPDFVQRPALWRWMAEQYSRPGQRMALVGMGGFGKSQLAIHFAHHVQAENPGTSVFWVRGNSRVTFEESYRTLAGVLALPRRHDPEVDVLALVREWLQRDDVGPWLLILDNADDAHVFYPGESAVETPLASYLPKSPDGKIFVTSRSLDAALPLVGTNKAIRHVPVMEEEQSMTLFRKKLDGDVDEPTVRRLVQALGCVPLAVSQAAAYVNRHSPRIDARSYLDHFHRGEKWKDSLLRADKGDLGRYDGVSNSVVVTWQMTFEQIQRERPSAANLLSLMSRFQPQNIPEKMLHGYVDGAV